MSRSWPSMIVGSLFSNRPREIGSNCKVSCFASAFFRSRRWRFRFQFGNWTNERRFVGFRFSARKHQLFAGTLRACVHLDRHVPASPLSEEVQGLPPASKEAV